MGEWDVGYGRLKMWSMEVWLHGVVTGYGCMGFQCRGVGCGMRCTRTWRQRVQEIEQEDS